MGFQDVIALLIAAAAATFAFRSLWRTMNSGGCGSSGGCSHSAADRHTNGIVRKPLVRVDQIGLPESAVKKVSILHPRGR